MLLKRLLKITNNVAITTDVVTTAVLDTQQTAGGMLYVNSGVGLTTLTWHVCDTVGGTFLPAKDGIGGAVTTTIAPSQACLIPAALFAAAFIKAVGNASAVLTVSLKA